ncbi:hypothetical protein KA005_33220 [bacterium]|nr:hypothetical protein [bacterium]
MDLADLEHSQNKSLKVGEKILDSWGIMFLVEGGSGTGVVPVKLIDQPMLQYVYPNPSQNEATITSILPDHILSNLRLTK